jgi:GAF domain-containing protein
MPNVAADEGQAHPDGRERALLDRLAAGAPLGEVLEDLVRAVERESGPGVLASILLLDEAGERLLHGAAPSLPQAYNEAIHGIAIGPGMGSCGTAAYVGHPIYVTDIGSDPLWKDFRGLAFEHGLRACWSTPIEGDDGRILGTFAVYHTAPRSPTPDQLAAINRVSHIAAAVIARAAEGEGRGRAG